MNIVVASGNAHKVAELQSLATLAGLNPNLNAPNSPLTAPQSPFLTFTSARDVGGMPTVIEDTGTFVGNASKKARALWEKLARTQWVLADDSGICVDALGGGPGVESAYFAGPQGDSAANLAKLVEVMRDVPDDRRGATFKCVLLLIGPDGAERAFSGECRGRLLHEPRGGHGFGYDPLLVPEGSDRTFAELGDTEKNRLSHRARAFAALAGWVRGVRINSSK